MSKLWTFCNYSLMSRIYEQIFKFGINMVKISVVIPIYNCEEYLEESIRSILNQTFKDIEIVCVDDGSTDNSLDILNKLASDDSRLKVFSQENQGSSFARNNALRKVSGDYVYFFDANNNITGLINDANGFSEKTIEIPAGTSYARIGANNSFSKTSEKEYKDAISNGTFRILINVY